MANIRPVVALLESRMSRELARLVEKHGGDPLCVPAVRECPEFTPEVAQRLLQDLEGDRHEVVVFMTGVAVSLLFETAEQIGRRPDLVAALRRLTTVCRGPKPTAALRGFGVPPTLTARDPFTSAELIDAMSGIDLKGRRVILLHYGERSETLAETLLARQAKLEELWLYRWLMPEDTEGLARVVMRIISGEVDALAITCQIQFRHLYTVADQLGLGVKLVRALNERVAVAAVGPTCQAILHAYGVQVQVMPDHPKMGPLVLALMRHLEQRRSPAEPSASEMPRITH
ncbi:MAG TPA: uroporphyrinogen-III synthase [Polyangiaceae bacterium]|nr:uroporphyrinogen-III synthase [Polyangiaceae bacterium]